MPSVDDVAVREMRRLTRRSFAVGGIAALAGVGGFWWLKTRDKEGDLPDPLRKMLEWNERVSRACFRPTRLAATFPLSAARMPRINGLVGLLEKGDVNRWKLAVETPLLKKALAFDLDDIRALPRIELITELKCVEGWSVPVRWTGARFMDFAAKFGLASRDGRPGDVPQSARELFRYVSMSTPNQKYYVGLDVESALHPQTLLCYEMDGAPLTVRHGAPLRLTMPIKYGYKSLKCIGKIRFTDERPADFWAKYGYDWYAGH